MARFLCVCEGGNVRSRAMAYVLHDLLGHEAIPIGTRWASQETKMLLCRWADMIVVMQPHLANSIPDEFRVKTRCVDVGPDSYGLHIPSSLMAQVNIGAKYLLEELAKKG